MTPYLQDPDITLYNGDALEVLRTLPDRSVQSGRSAGFECPGCGCSAAPTVAARCAERIRFYGCQECDFSTWNLWEFSR